MSDALRIALVGATGLVGSAVIAQCVGREDLRLTGIARRETPLPRGIRMELFVADPAKWGEVIEAVRPKAMICALGTTRKKVGGDEAAFRAVEHRTRCARAGGRTLRPCQLGRGGPHVQGVLPAGQGRGRTRSGESRFHAA